MKKSIVLLLLACIVSVAVTGCGGKGSQSATGGSGQVFVVPDDEEGEEEPEVKENIKKVKISATGDCAIGRVQVHAYTGSFEAYYDSYGPDYFLKNVRKVFKKDDFTLVNCECVLSNETGRVEQQFNIKGKPEYVKIFSGSSVEGATLGNNHSADYGEKSRQDTIEALEGADIACAVNDRTAVYETEDGVKIGFVSVCMLGDFDNRSAYMENGLKDLRDRVDILIACPHMGSEGEHIASAAQQEFFHKCVNWGADLVIGNHPHVLQGAEIYKGKVIMYSLGNFCFGANHNPKDYDTVIYQQTFTIKDGELQDKIKAKIIPCSISSQSGNNNYQPRIYSSDDDKKRVISKMNDYSAPFGKVHFNEKGRLKKS